MYLFSLKLARKTVRQKAKDYILFQNKVEIKYGYSFIYRLIFKIKFKKLLNILYCIKYLKLLQNDTKF